MCVALCLAFILLLCFGLTLWAVLGYTGPLKADPRPQPAILVAAQAAIDEAVRARNALKHASPGFLAYAAWREKYSEACSHVDRLREDYQYLKRQTKRK